MIACSRSSMKMDLCQAWSAKVKDSMMAPMVTTSGRIAPHLRHSTSSAAWSHFEAFADAVITVELITAEATRPAT